MNLFGMITTSGSRDYTPLALRSFFSRTPLGTSDRLILIDNDADFVVPDDVPRQRLTVVRPERPQGFAVNANMLLAEARQREADLFLLNNDLVFTSSWLTPGVVTDRSDPKLAHIDGLNLSRAWMLEGIARGLSPNDRRVPVLQQTAARHAEVALPAVTGQYYEGGHWLGTFAVYLTSRAGLR